MTYKRHPMNKRINASRRRQPRPNLSAAMRAVARGMSVYADAVATVLARAGEQLAAASRALRSLPPHRSEYTLAN